MPRWRHVSSGRPRVDRHARRRDGRVRHRSHDRRARRRREGEGGRGCIRRRTAVQRSDDHRRRLHPGPVDARSDHRRDDRHGRVVVAEHRVRRLGDERRAQPRRLTDDLDRAVPAAGRVGQPRGAAGSADRRHPVLPGDDRESAPARARRPHPHPRRPPNPGQRRPPPLRGLLARGGRGRREADGLCPRDARSAPRHRIHGCPPSAAASVTGCHRIPRRARDVTP